MGQSVWCLGGGCVVDDVLDQPSFGELAVAFEIQLAGQVGKCIQRLSIQQEIHHSIITLWRSDSQLLPTEEEQ